MKFFADTVKSRFGFWLFIFCLLGIVSFFTLNNCGGGGGGSSDGTLPPIISGDYIIADHLAAMATVPEDAINDAKSSLHIAYGHTSHGSQIISGMDALESWNSSLYGGLDLREPWGVDLGTSTWATATRTYLNSHPEVNVIIWSWCGQVSDATEASINTYLSLMNQLEADYPSVKFVYMTGHLDGTGANGNLNVRNQQIRAYCLANNKILFDFADIESYDPSGNEFMTRNANDNCDYSDGSGSGNWAGQWIATHLGHELANISATICTDCCAHSQNLNCALKGRAIWWLWARLAGWNP